MSEEPAATPEISHEIWDMKYRFKRPDGTPVDETVEQSWQRVAKAVAAVEPGGCNAHWEAEFYEALSGYKFLPAGRILAGAGTGRRVTLFNCFVMGTLDDDMSGIFDGLKEAALTMQQGGGIGQDFSTLRPNGAPVRGVGADASGPLSFMDVWDAMCRTIMSAGSRRGAMMATLRCDHPDIEEFITAKQTPGRLTMFNLSVLVTDAFMAAVKDNTDWPLVFGGEVFRTVKARELWDKILRANYDFAEPGAIFIDRVNALNNLSYAETINCTNPCGEQPLPPYGACLLGSINLAQIVRNPFGDDAAIDEAELAKLTALAVRMMDNVIDASRFPLDSQRQEAEAKRRIGLGVTGLADALIMCGKRYGTDAAAALARSWMKSIERAAYLTSTELAAEKGAFALFDKEAYLAGEHISALDKDVRKAISKHGMRNALVTSIAPTGTISLFAGNVSSGIEPVFAWRYTRKVLQPDGSRSEEQVTDYAYRKFQEKFGADAALPDYFVTAQELSPQDHIAMQAAMQPHVDSSISKTVNVPEALSFEAFKDVYALAYEKGLKGCTTYRPNRVRGSVLETTATNVAEGDADTGQTSLPLDAPVPMTGDGADIVYMKQPLEREKVLPGFTYKLKWADSDHAIYITLNDIIQNERRRPFEIFINSKNMEHYAWTVALTRMISAVFRRGGDVSFVVEELKAVFDPRGGQWMGGKYVPSLLAAIGGIIERHMIDTGFLKPDEAVTLSADPEAARQAMVVNEGRASPQQCPKCGEAALIFQEGCRTCLSCGHSKCS
ncbi:MAG: adenosylcobalamin-dependent ribonucleoside-diphosphate reductase [Hyphomicrobiales bacterium]